MNAGQPQGDRIVRLPSAMLNTCRALLTGLALLLTALTAGPAGAGVGVYYIHTDHLGTPQAMTDPAQQVVWAAQAMPFGQTTVTLEAVRLNLRFPGQYFDAESGLHYNYFRDYDPGTGRYVQSDPIGLEGGINTYAYAENDPVLNSDPFGLWVKRCSRKLGDREKPEVRSRTPFRHDYLNVSGRILSFQAGGNIAWSQGRIDGNEDQNKGCVMVCDDDKFDAYVLASADEIGAPKYCLIAYPGTLPHLAGARNCQTWADDVLQRAKEKYLKAETCPKCFK